MPDNTSLVTTYVVNNTNQFITLTLIIGGPEQTATSLIAIDDDIRLPDHAGDLFDYQLGHNNDLQGKKLKITTTITDTADDHNHTELIIRLKGGVLFREYPLSKEVEVDGSATYYAEISFYSFS